MQQQQKVRNSICAQPLLGSGGCCLQACPSRKLAFVQCTDTYNSICSSVAPAYTVPEPCPVLQGAVRLSSFSGAANAALDASPQKRQLLHGVLAISTAQSLPDRLSSGLLGSESCDASGKRVVEVETDQKFVDDGYR